MEISPFSDFDLISHPHQSLAKHLQGCDRISEKVLAMKYLSSDFYSKADLETWRKLLVYFHDFGKGTDYFQHRIIEATEREAVEDFFENQKPYIAQFRKTRGLGTADELRYNSDLGSHARLGGYFLFSHFAHDDPVLQVILLKIIQRHHGYLTNFAYSGKDNKPVIQLTGEALELLNKQCSRQNFELYNKILVKVGLSKVEPEQWAGIKEQFAKQRTVTKWEDALTSADTYRYFSLQHYLFSILLSADKGDMQLPRDESRHALIRENQLIDEGENLVERYKKQVFKNAEEKPIDRQREQAFQDIAQNAKDNGGDSFFSITLPTGMGKTFAAYKAAFLLQKRFTKDTGTKPHIVYCLPFTSVIDQNAAILQDIFEKNGLDKGWISIHHYLSHLNERYDDTEQNIYDLDYPASEYMTEGWEHDVVVTTFVQFLESIFSNRNRALRKFHNLAHAIVVLDEVQAIPPKYFNAVEDALRHLAKYFGTKFLFVTATQPLLFEKRKGVIELTDPTLEKTRAYFGQMERIELDQSLLRNNGYQEMEDLEIQSLILADIEENPDKSVLVICNTIKQSQEMFRFLQNSLDAEVPVRYLSSSIIPYCRKRLIDAIKNYKSRQILVSTQVVEAGVDIDFDIVWRDWAPLDSINQSAGRCNRNGIKGKGKVKLFHAGKAKHIYDSKLLGATRDVLQSNDFGNIIPEGRFLELNNRYADAIQKAVAEENPTSYKLKEAMKNLQLETVNELFRLIPDDNLSYNVFIPYNEEAEAARAKFNAIFKNIKDRFERKAELKKLRPELLPFVTRFPKNKYQPPENQKDNFLIFPPDWKNWYDLVTGFRDPADSFF